MKRILSLICLICISLSVLSFTSCGFFDEETGKMISKIEKTAEFEDGSSEITIYYTDPYYKPEKFIVPAGKQGDAGISVLDVTSEDGTNEQEGFTIVTITLSEKNPDGTYVKKPFAIPDGKTIVDVYADVDDITGEDVIVFAFNGDSEPISMPMPEFNAVERMELVEDGNGGYALKVKYTLDAEDAEMTTIGTIAAPVGIDHVEGSEEDGKYVLYVHYTDGSVSEPINFDKPTDPNSWSTFETKPGDTVGRVGDFCFAEDENVIYSKVVEGEGEDRSEFWKPVMTFVDKSTRHNVYFFKNDGTDGSNDTYWKSESVLNGTYFSSTGKQVPVPTRNDGYKFVGWYTTSDYDYVKENQAVMSSFTNFTPVNSELKLYAIWEPVSN